MSSTPGASRREDDGAPIIPNDPNPPTVASFSPATLSHATSANKQRSTILVHQKSPLLIATPPQITRALAYSHPFLLPLNKLAGLITWTSGDEWESFLLVAGFWAVVLYGDVAMRFGGPVVVVMGLILGMYSRRYSPLSSSSWTGEKQKKGHKRMESEATKTKHQKTLDEIVETLKIFTSRCNVLLDPLLELTDFLSTQRTATSATTRPALTTLLLRILLVTPIWIIFTLPPIALITTKRITLVSGTIFLTWHSRPTKVTRAILWRSASIRKFCTIITGLHFTDTLAPTPPTEVKPDLPPRRQSEYQEKAHLAASQAAKRRPDAAGVRFTFILYENQRRWVGLGWTTSLFGYERAAWTDEHLSAAPAKDEFELPDVEGGASRWRWVDGSQWLVEGAAEMDEGGTKAKADATDGGQGWIYYDNKVRSWISIAKGEKKTAILTHIKWQNGRRGIDGWGRYTRRRKWYRDAELVEVSPSTEITPLPSPSRNPSIPPSTTASTPNAPPLPPRIDLSSSTTTILGTSPSNSITSIPEKDTDSTSINSKDSSLKSFGGARASIRRRGTGASGSRRSSLSTHTTRTVDSEEHETPRRARESDWGIGDDAVMGLE